MPREERANVWGCCKTSLDCASSSSMAFHFSIPFFFLWLLLLSSSSEWERIPRAMSIGFGFGFGFFPGGIEMMVFLMRSQCNNRGSEDVCTRRLSMSVCWVMHTY